MEELFSSICRFNGKNVRVTTNHKVFGSQSFTGTIELVCHPDRIGFAIHQQQIYIPISEITCFHVSATEVSYMSKNMEIKIKLKK